MLYRLYQPADFAQLYAIEEACFQPPIRFSRRYIRQLMESPSSATWVAEEEGRLAGFAIATWDDDGQGPSPYIQTIEVAAEYRRRGVGRELLARIEQSVLGAVGPCAIWLHVDATNSSAIRLYRAHGYEHRGTRQHYYARSRHADIYSKRLLPGGESSAQ